jgi:hypothetical protein
MFNLKNPTKVGFFSASFLFIGLLALMVRFEPLSKIEIEQNEDNRTNANL